MDHVLVGLAVAAGLVVFVYVSPTKPCRCSGHCGRCKGTGRRFRIGAPLARRAATRTYRELRQVAIRWYLQARSSRGAR